MINNDLTAQGVIEVLSSDDPSVSDGEGCYNLELEVSIYFYYNLELSIYYCYNLKLKVSIVYCYSLGLEVSKYDCFKKLIFYK